MRFDTLRFIHAAHLRLDAQLPDIRWLGKPHRATVQDATLKAFDRVIEAAIDHDAAFLLLTGQLFSDDGPTLRSLLRLKDGLDVLDDANIVPVLAIDDRQRLAASPLADLAEGVLTIPVGPTHNSQQTISAHGRVVAHLESFARPNGADGWLDGGRGQAFAVSDSQVDLALAILPEGFDPRSWSQRDDAAHAATARSGRLNYVTSSTGRRRQTIVQGETMFHQPGVAQALWPATTGTQGCSLLTVNHEGTLHPTFVPTSSVRRETIPLAISGDEDWDAVVRAMRRQLDVERRDEREDLVIYRWEFKGSSRGLLALESPELQQRLIERLMAEADLPPCGHSFALGDCEAVGQDDRALTQVHTAIEGWDERELSQRLSLAALPAPLRSLNGSFRWDQTHTTPATVRQAARRLVDRWMAGVTDATPEGDYA